LAISQACLAVVRLAAKTESRGGTCCLSTEESSKASGLIFQSLERKDKRNTVSSAVMQNLTERFQTLG